MAADYIVISRTNRPQLGNQLIAAANRLKELRELVDGLNDAGQHMFDGADYSVMETQFGLAAGTGANTLTLIGYLQEIFNSETEVTGATRLARIDEFQSRLAGQ